MSAASIARWYVTDRRTGGITVAQRPNALSATSMVAGIAGAVLPGRAGRLARRVREVAVVAWGVDELARGVNPWRRTLGAATLALQAHRLSRRR